jgi:hypothetical protein
LRHGEGELGGKMVLVNDGREIQTANRPQADLYRMVSDGSPLPMERPCVHSSIT